MTGNLIQYPVRTHYYRYLPTQGEVGVIRDQEVMGNTIIDLGGYSTASSLLLVRPEGGILPKPL